MAVPAPLAVLARQSRPTQLFSRINTTVTSSSNELFRSSSHGFARFAEARRQRSHFASCLPLVQMIYIA